MLKELKREVIVNKVNYTITEIEKMAEYVASSGLFGVKDKKQAVALLLLAQSEGLHPMTAVRKYHIIQGKPAKTAETMLAEFKQVGGKVKWHQLDNNIADATFISPDGDEIRITWTLEDAKRAGLHNRENWKKYPRAMLRSRVISEGIRTIYPQIVFGVYTPDEVIDIVENQSANDDVVEAQVEDESGNKIEKEINTLKNLGLEAIVKDGWIKADGKKVYEKKELLKKLGYQYFPSKKIWAKKLA